MLNDKVYKKGDMVGVGMLGGLVGGYSGITIMPGVNIEAYIGSLMLAICFSLVSMWIYLRQKQFLSRIRLARMRYVKPRRRQLQTSASQSSSNDSVRFRRE